MPEKKGSVRKATAAVRDVAAAVVRAADEHIVQPVGKALGLTGQATPQEGKEAGHEPPATDAAATNAAATDPAATDPAVKPAGTKSAAVRMMTRPVGGKKPAAARGEAQRVADAAKPSQKPAARGGRRGPRRGASKGR
jgi:hypothetical protein